jgi:hypothetical protein
VPEAQSLVSPHRQARPVPNLRRPLRSIVFGAYESASCTKNRAAVHQPGWPNEIERDDVLTTKQGLVLLSSAHTGLRERPGICKALTQC